MECGLCGTLNRDLARFCGGCGAPLGRVCVNCKSEIDAGLRFCDQCGTPVEGAEVAVAPAPAQRRTPEAVRKTVTVLFADLGGSTGFGERTDPEVSRQVLARYHALLQEAIDAHRGTVAKFMGDGMMATFGIPEVAEDDAERAVRAGIEIQDRFARFADDVAATFGERLTARVGVNTGEVVIGAADADLVGDALNVAARLEKACRPGHVLVGDDTWRLTRGVLAYESLGEVTVAGRAQPVGTYEVATSERAAETVAPFVGRDTELARLVTAFDHARSERAAVLVTVIGSPGLGKTRLSRELAARVSAAGDAATFEIRCDRSGGSTFAPVADLLREAAGLEVSEADDTVTHEKLGALIRDDGDRARVVDALAAVLGAAPARSVEETFWAVRRTMESLAAEHPLLVVIDDIQWAEPKLLDLIDHLAEWVTGVPLLLVGLARPELRDLRPAFVESGRRVSHVVALDGLDVHATEALAAGLLGSALPRELVDRLPASTDGNPLFVRELVRMLVDDGVVRRRDDGTWDLAIDADAVEVPPTIQSLLATRVERLPADELRLLELASVVGAEFSDGALHALGGDDLAFPTLLERLRRKELVEPTGTYWGDEPLHRFHHVLIRDAAYRRLLKGARADLHRRVGEWTDATARNVVGEHETTIAFHYEQAHRYRSELGTLDDETDRLGRRAAELLDVAARRAFDRDDLASAGVLASRALAVLPDADVETRAELLLMACECLLASGDVAAGAPLVDDLTGVGADDPKLSAWASCFHAQLVALTDPDRLVEAEEIATNAAETLRGLGDGAGEAKAHQVRALLLARLGRVGEAEAVLDLALGAARAADDRRRVTAVLGAAPQAALFGPSPVARAGGRCLDVVRLLRITTASPSVEATSMRCQAVLEALRSRFDVSRSMLASSRTSLEELGLRHGLLETDLYAGIVELIAGEPAAAVGPLRAAYEGLGTLGVGADAGQAAALLATALLAQGETDEAELMAAESEALAGQNLKTAIAWRIAKASVLAARDAVAEGVALAQEAVEIASATDLVLDHADACVVLADLQDTAGDAAGARAARDEARRLYEAKGATVPAERLASNARQVAAPSVASSPFAIEPRAARTPACENTTTRLVARLTGYMGTDLAPPTDLVSESFALDDRRALVGLPRGGGDEIWANFSMMRDQGYRIEAPVPVAVRGERLALHRTIAVTPSGDETALLSIDELDGDLRIASVTWFDDDDLLVAIAELERRYFFGEGAPFQRVLAAVGRYSAAYEHHDLDGVRTQLAPDLVMVDHEPVRWGSGGRDLFLEMSRDGIGEDGRGVNHVVYVNEHALLGVSTQALRSDEGSRYERSSCAVIGVDASDRINRVEIFPSDDFDAALVVLDELGAGGPPDPRTPVAENRASRFMEQLRLAFNDPDSGALGRLLARDRVHDDRRSIVALVDVDDGEGLAEFAAASEQGFAFVEPEVIAVRGERLALTRMVARTPAGDESARLSVNELDADGRLVYSALFDTDDLGAAMAELDRRYYAGEGAPFQRVLRAVGRYAAASYRDDFDALRDHLAPDFVFVDHQPLGAGEGDRDYYTEFSRTRAAEGSLVNRVLHVNDRAVLAVQHARMTSDQGGVYERLVCIVFGVGADDRIDRIEVFPYEDFDAALALLDALGAGTTAEARSAGVDNATIRVMRRVIDLCHERRFDDMRRLLADDFVREDRRQGVSAPTADGPDEFVRAYAAWFDVGFETLAMEPLAIRGERLGLARLEWRSPDGRNVGFLAVYELDADGRTRRGVHFDDGDVEAAVAELDAWHASGEGEATARRLGALPSALPLLANAATRGTYQTLDLLQERRWDEARDRYSDDFVRVDRRAVVNEGTVAGPDAMIESLRVIFENSEGVTLDVLAVRGECLALVRIGVLTHGFESVVLQVRSFDTDGRCDTIEIFDDDDLDAALAALDARYLAGEGSAHVDVLLPCIAFRSASVDGDFDTLRGLLAPDFTFRDHRRLGFGTGDRDYYLAASRTRTEVAADGPIVNRLVEVEGDALLTLQTEQTNTPEGSAYERGAYVVMAVGASGRIRAAEWFDDDRAGDARARLHELGVPRPAAPVLENAATRAEREAISLLEAYLRSGGTATLRLPRTSPDFVTDDRRPIVGMPDQDRAGVNAVIGTMLAQGYVGARTEAVAVRGDRLALNRRTLATESGDETHSLVITELDGAGRFRQQTLFAEPDLDAALAELDARFLAGEGAGSLPVLAAGVAWIEASRNRDVDALRAVVAPDLVCVDHQPLGFGTLDRDGIIAATELRFEVSSDDVVIVRSVQVDGPVLMARHYSETTTDEGNRYEREAIYVLRVDADGRIDRWDVYGDEQSDAADARFRELATPHAGPVVANAGSRTIERTLALLNAGDYEGLSDLDAVAEHVVRYDRRKLVSAPPIEGAEAFGLNAVGFLDVFDTVDPEVVAVRGERLALLRLHFGRAPDFVLRLLCLYEFDADGRIAWEADYDDDDLPDALTELDERFVVGEGAAHERILRICGAFEEVNNARDFDATLAMLADDFVMADRTRLGFGEGDREYFDAANRSREDVAIDGSAVVRLLDVDGDALVSLVEGHRLTREGNDYAWVSCIVIQVDADDRIRRTEYYDEADYATAVARMHELAAAPRTDRSTASLDNLATRLHARILEAINAGDRNLQRALTARDFAQDDRRAVVGVPDQDARGIARYHDIMLEQGYEVLPPEPLAVRGDRLTLARVTHRTAAGDESILLALIELDANGSIVRATAFDEDALGLALDELDERYAAGEGAEHADVVRRTSDLRHATAAHDWAAIEALVGDDFAFRDHRPIGLPDADRAGYVAAMVASTEQTPNTVMMGRAIEIRDGVALTRTRRVGATVEGFEYDWEQLAVIRWGAGRLRLVELFAVGDEAAARARFAELAAQRSPYVDNDAVRTVIRAYWLRRFVGPAAAGHLVSRDIAGEDRRHTVSMPEFHGRAGFAHAMDATDAVFSDGADIVPLAVRGERLALVRDRLRHGDDELEVLNLWEIDEDGRLVHATLFDPADFADAVHLLDVRHAELRTRSEPRDRSELRGDPRTPEPDNLAGRVMIRLGRLAWTDLDAAMDLFAADAAGATRQTGPMAGSSAFGRDGWRNVVRSFVDAYDGVRFEPVAVRGERLALLRYEFVARGFESVAVLVVELDDEGRIHHIDTFDDVDLADAIELLERRDAMLSGDGYAPPARQMAEAERQLNRGASGDLGVVLAPDFSITDRQQLGAWTFLDRHEYLESVRVFVEQTPARAFLFPKWYVDGDVAIATTRSIGLTPEGSRYEWSNVQVLAVDGRGRALRVELLPEDAWADALALFDEWSEASAAPGSPGLENTATRVAAEFIPALYSGDVERIRPFIADRYRYVDHRFSGVSPEAEGFEAFFAQMRAYAEVGFRELTSRVVAVRGERLLLAWSENESRQGYRTVELRIAEIDADGKFVRTDVYDESDLAGAIVDLNARYRDSGEATEAELTALEAIDALNRRDWDALRATLDPDVVAVDHQPLGFEPTDRDGFVGSWMGGLVAMMPDAVSVVAEVRGEGPAVFGRIVTRGDTVDGNEYEWDSLVVGRFGRGARLEFFPLDQRDAALALLDEWGAARAAVGPDNAAARTMVRWYGLSRAGDPTADALTTDDIAMVDRRRGVSLPMIEGRDAFNEAMAATDAVFAGMDVTPIAVRGERLALINVLRSNDGFELSTLVLVEAASDGRIHRVVIFGESDLVAALAVLDRRHGAIAVDLLPVERNQLATYAALNRRDWPAFTAGLDDDLAIVDHRRIGFPPGRGAGALAGELQGLVAQVPDVVAYVTAIRARGRAALVTTHQHGTATVGGHATWDFHTVLTSDADGRVVSLEYFDHDRWDDAAALFDAWSAEPEVAPAAPMAALAEPVSEAFARRDWDWIRAQVADDMELRDLRSTVSSHVATGADAVIELLRGFADVGFVSMANEVVDTRGPRLALLRRTYRTDAGFELAMLALAERNDAGLIAGMVLFDADDLDAATAELDRRDDTAGA